MSELFIFPELPPEGATHLYVEPFLRRAVSSGLPFSWLLIRLTTQVNNHEVAMLPSGGWC